MTHLSEIKVKISCFNNHKMFINSYVPFSQPLNRDIEKRIVLFKSLRNFKRRNKRNFTLKFNSNKIMLFGGGGQYYLVLDKISM